MVSIVISERLDQVALAAAGAEATPQRAAQLAAAE